MRDPFKSEITFNKENPVFGGIAYGPELQRVIGDRTNLWPQKNEEPGRTAAANYLYPTCRRSAPDFEDRMTYAYYAATALGKIGHLCRMRAGILK